MANAVSVFNLDNITVRQQGDLFSLGDLHTASGSEEKHKSSNFLRLDTTQALIAEMAKGSDVSLFLQVVKGRNGGTYACRELVIAYAAWINAAFHLKVIRVFLAVAALTTPYSVQPSDVLTQDQQTALRRFLETAAAKLPADKRGAFLQSGWGKLKKHTGVPYRQIPQAQHADALSLLARHVVEWEVVDDTPKPALPDPKRRMVELPPGHMPVDRRKLAAVWVDLGKLRKRIDGLGVLESDLPPSWWQENAISE